MEGSSSQMLQVESKLEGSSSKMLQIAGKMDQTGRFQLPKIATSMENGYSQKSKKRQI